MNSKFIEAVNASTAKIKGIDKREVLIGSNEPVVFIALTLNGEEVASAYFSSKWGFCWNSGPNFTVVGCDNSVRDAIKAKVLPLHKKSQRKQSVTGVRPATDLAEMVTHSTAKVIRRGDLTDVVFSYKGTEICTVGYIFGQTPKMFWALDPATLSEDIKNRPLKIANKCLGLAY